MMWILRSGAPWRDLPESFGKWTSVFQRFRRWCKQGIFDALLERLVELGITDAWESQMVESTIVRAHSQAAGVRGVQNQGLGRSRGGFTSKIHLRADAICLEGLHLAPVGRHAVVVADLAVLLHAEYLRRIDTCEGDEGAPLLFRLDREPRFGIRNVESRMKASLKPG